MKWKLLFVVINIVFLKKKSKNMGYSAEAFTMEVNGVEFTLID